MLLADGIIMADGVLIGDGIYMADGVFIAGEDSNGGLGAPSDICVGGDLRWSAGASIGEVPNDILEDS